jgi:geranyl-CoA carboxylase alpha subunit
MPRFTKVLVANRGEIAVRVIRGARKAGYQTVAVYADADQHALHVREADQAVHIGPSPAKDSYLVIERILAAARASGAQAIHPGYGFLSERADFAQAVKDAGLVFIGPDAASIEAMGNKSASKIRMLAASVPCVPGYQGDDQSDATLIAEARQVGLPVMVKAASGGGGRGMRLVHDDHDLAAAITSARSEAENAFGSGQLLIEKAVLNARHVEIQIFGDRQGNVVHLGERDCSVQRRNQKVVEEAPSPAVDPALRERMGAAAVAAAQAVNYVGAGTVEFMLAADGAFYFLEMNTRLQVEHPVTELVYGVDLVEWQLRVAQGESLPMTQAEIDDNRYGHAIEVRLCAEDPLAGDLPQTGEVLRWQVPHGAGLRVDTYLESGMVISPFYDSMQAKLIAWGEDRETARARLLALLADTQLFGVISNKDYLAEIVAHPAFASGAFSTGFLAEHFPASHIDTIQPRALDAALAALGLYLSDARKLASEHGLSADYLGWHSSHDAGVDFLLRSRGQDTALEVLAHKEGRFEVLIGDQTLALTVESHHEHGLSFSIDGVMQQARWARSRQYIWVEYRGRTWCWEDRTLAPVEGAAPGSDGRLLAHTDGKLVAVHVKAGDRIEKGQTLAVLEAMKMEFQLKLPVGGVVESVSVEPGTQVRNKQVLVAVTVDAS